MKNIIKYGAIALAGYLVGFYEYKYKMTKALLNAKLAEDATKKDEA